MVTSLLLLATLFLIQARKPLKFLATWTHCSCSTVCWPRDLGPFLMSNFLPTLPQETACGWEGPCAVPSIYPCWMLCGRTRIIDLPYPGTSAEHSVSEAVQQSCLLAICKFPEWFNPFISIIEEDTKQIWPQYWALEYTTCDCLPIRFISFHNNPYSLAI